jgi:hypothetical protein
MVKRRWSSLVAASCAVLFSAACNDSREVVSPAGPQLNVVTEWKLSVCKFWLDGVGTAQVSVSATSGTVLASQVSVSSDCVPVWTGPAGTPVTVTLTELPSSNYVLEGILPFATSPGVTINGNTISITQDYIATANEGLAYVTFKNRLISFTPGRMTGGGGQLTIGNVFISRGFTIHCDITLSNNIEINWPGNKWHLDKPITSALCIDDPTISPTPPDAPFDTFIGTATGRLNGVDGSLLRFIFVDDGERGAVVHDKAQIQIWDAGGNLVLNVPLSVLNKGNIQAHYDQPHK